MGKLQDLNLELNWAHVIGRKTMGWIKSLASKVIIRKSPALQRSSLPLYGEKENWKGEQEPDTQIMSTNGSKWN